MSRASSLSYTGRAALARDFLLQLFSRSNRVLLSSFTSVAQLDLAASRAMIGSLADFDPDSKEWVFKCPFDDAFGRQYPGIVAQQSAVLARVDYEAQLLGKSARAGPALAPVPAEDIYSGSSSDEDDTMIGRNAIPHRAAAPAGVNVESARPSKQERPAVEPPSAMDVDPSEALVNAALDHLSDVGVCSAPTLSSVLSQSSDPSLRKTTLDEIERVLNRVAKPFVKGTFCRSAAYQSPDTGRVSDARVSSAGSPFQTRTIPPTSASAMPSSTCSCRHPGNCSGRPTLRLPSWSALGTTFPTGSTCASSRNWRCRPPNVGSHISSGGFGVPLTPMLAVVASWAAKTAS